MKKLLLSLILVVTFVSAAFADVVLVPEWSEICPISYINARPATGYFDSKKLGTYNDYWVTRKRQFETAINNCQKTYTDSDLAECYAKVEKKELEKNKIYNATIKLRNDEIDRQHQEYMQRKQLRDTVDGVNSIIRTIKY